MSAISYYLVSASRQARRILPNRAYVFGREEGVDIVVPDALVSRRHAELRWVEGSGWVLSDLNSRNGTFVNGQRLSAPTALADGAQIQIGGQVFRLHLLPAGGDPASLSAQAPQISAMETMGPGVSLAELSAQGATFTGALTEAGLLELLQFFVQTGKSGRLDLLGASGQHAVWLVGGAPVHAVSGAAEGFAALLALARRPPPRFAFHQEALPPKRSLQGGGQALLMDLARELDESSKAGGR
ncbi:MAG: FHA domain-containing protein [Planctomycetota bacterium]|nr:FHA domain-containing protein [Planctomycetota bacterium]MCX8039145.1 FHA domain-containing protein [Planctomycetota bacterium]MDW8372563.1 FHA domain-containing protein [Planctomycetota bacterium]